MAPDSLTTITTIWTIGHSTRTLEEFFALLKAHEIRCVADVRHFPGSRKYPHFGKEPLAAALKCEGINYVHLLDLGGRRKVRADSPNTAWRNASFRGYADYMETESFQHGMARLLEIARREPTAIMCAEAVWWRCHRSMISDWLKADGVQVLHILSEKKADPHPWTSAACVANGELTYGKTYADGEESGGQQELALEKKREKAE